VSNIERRPGTSPPRRLAWLVGLSALLAGWPCLPLRAADDPSPDDFFEASVRPVLVDACIRCHGPKKQRGGLRLDSRAAVLAGGDNGPALVPGQPGKSRLIAAVRHAGELKMPPDRPLSAPKIAALVRWVELGAPWPAKPGATKSRKPAEHWAFQPVKVPGLPAVRDAAWVRTPVDRFILAKLEAEGLTPSPPADRRTLARRAFYDLTGLPPTPEQVEAFAQDDAPDAYAKLIEQLLASPRYGEQWGRHWLDVARYSDTKGYVYGREERFWVHAWAYRDWVIRSLNRDMPYDQFLMLQLAADQVAADDPPSQAAMGFLTLGRRFLGVTHDIIDDRIDTVTRGMLGLTVACARCHNHKYDPIPTADYYSLYGVFRSCSEREVPAEVSTASGPKAEAFARGLRDRQRKLADTLATRRREAADRVRARVGDYLTAQLELQKYPEEGFDQILAPTDIIPASVRRWRDYLARSAASRDPVFAAWHAFARLPEKEFPSRAGEVCRRLATASPAEVHPLVARSFATPPRDMREVARRYGALFTRLDTRRRSLLGASAGGPVVPVPGATRSDTEAIGKVLYAAGSPCVVPDEPIVSSEGFFPSGVVTELWNLQGEVDRWLIRSPDAPAYATILVDRPVPTNARIFRRGNPATLGAEVPRQFLQVLSGPDRKPFRVGSGRLELAKAIASPDNPLTARVLVNRVWMHHFGAGLVRTPSDFGTRAAPPSHPQLLDWLAARFVAEGWSLKTLHRHVMLSAAYRQASTGPADQAARAQALARDPDNRWLWRMNARRLSFEELRDSLFAVTGDLDRRAGGKPVDLFARPFSARRTVYGLVDRQFPVDLLRVFDFANPDLHVPQRSETTVPQQALFFLNHPLMLDRARALAGHSAVAAADTPEEKVRHLYRLAYQREPTAHQIRAALALVRDTKAEIASPAAARPSAWKYGVAAFDPKTAKLTEYRPLPHFSGEAWQGGSAWPDPTFGWAQLTADGGHPGNDLHHAVVRRWTAPADGTVRIDSTLIHQEAAGDGVRGSIVSSRHGLLKSAVAHNKRAKLNVDKVEVRAGDTIDFVVDILKVLNSDQHTWAPVITQIPSGRRWDAKAEFGGPAKPRLGPWEHLAQALLMTNEFYFAD
jgi:hypothetical protein